MRTRSMAVPMLGLAVLLAACGSGSGSTTAAPATPAPATAAPASEAPVASEAPASEAPATEAPATEAPSAAGAGAATVALADNTLGRILVDGAGMTLYVFMPDEGGTPTCYDACETAWPVLAGSSVTAGEGLTAADFGSVERTDGKTQVTFKGWPLYFFAADAAAGETKGQGLNDAWFVITADGTIVK